MEWLVDSYETRSPNINRTREWIKRSLLIIWKGALLDCVGEVEDHLGVLGCVGLHPSFTY